MLKNLEIKFHLYALIFSVLSGLWYPQYSRKKRLYKVLSGANVYFQKEELIIFSFQASELTNEKLRNSEWNWIVIMGFNGGS